MSRKTWGLLALAICAFAVRLAVVYALPQHLDRPQTYEHGEIARNVLAGRGFVVTFLGQEGPTSQQAPFVPYLLAAVYAVSGVDSVESLVTFQVLQCLSGVALVLGVIGVKMLLPIVGVHVDPIASLAIVVAIIAVSIGASILRPAPRS